MLKALMRTRIDALIYSLFRGSRRKKPASAGMKILIGLLALYLVACFFFMFGSLFMAIGEAFRQAGAAWFYFGFAGLISIVLSFVGSVFMTAGQLFQAKDNELLLSMPIPPAYILISRMAMLYVFDLLLELLVVIPAGVVWLMQTGASVPGVIIFIIAFLFLPLIPLTLSCVFGYVISAITSRLRNKNVFTLILSLAFFAAYFYFYSKMDTYIQKLIAGGSDIANAIRSSLPPIYYLGDAIVSGSILSLIIALAFAIIPFALVTAVIALSFSSIVATKKGAAHVKYEAKELRISSVDTALLIKELRHLGSNAMYMMNAGIGLVMMLGGAVYLAIKSADISPLLAQMNISMELMGPALILGMLFLLSMVTFTAPSISLEGKSLFISQSLPVEPVRILRAKCRMQLYVCLPFIAIVAAIVNIVFRPEGMAAVGLFLIPLLYSDAVGKLGVLVNLRFPKFDWTSETAAVKQGASVIITMLIAMVIAALPLIAFLLIPQDFLSVDNQLVAWFVIFVLSSRLLDRAIGSWGVKAFTELSN